MIERENINLEEYKKIEEKNDIYLLKRSEILDWLSHIHYEMGLSS